MKIDPKKEKKEKQPGEKVGWRLGMDRSLKQNPNMWQSPAPQLTPTLGANKANIMKSCHGEVYLVKWIDELWAKQGRQMQRRIDDEYSSIRFHPTKYVNKTKITFWIGEPWGPSLSGKDWKLMFIDRCEYVVLLAILNWWMNCGLLTLSMTS